MTARSLGTVGVLDVYGPASPPRSNGELVFAEPWESRAFGLALALHDGGAFEWEDFRQELIATIAAWDERLELLPVLAGGPRVGAGGPGRRQRRPRSTTGPLALALRPDGHDHDGTTTTTITDHGDHGHG